LTDSDREPFKDARKVLRAGEQVRDVIRYARNGDRNGDLVLTSERVLHVRHALLGFAMDEFPLGRIDAVSSQTGLMMGSIGITMGGHSYRFAELKNRRVSPMADAIRAAVATAREGGGVDLADLLRKLKELHDQGALTGDEFERAKQRYLGHGPDQRESMLRTLTGLNDLRRAGVLTQVEFEIKKRDFLASS
jgi:hypothetical protein